jgi:hypothetical protein
MLHRPATGCEDFLRVQFFWTLQLDVQRTPYASVSMPNRAPQNVSCSGRVTFPFAPSASNIVVISTTSSKSSRYLNIAVMGLVLTSLVSLADGARHRQTRTVIAWHRRGFRLFWTWKSRHRPGRPTVPQEVRTLIRTLSAANPLWGAPRIHGELLKLGFTVSQTTVATLHSPPPATALSRPGVRS